MPDACTMPSILGKNKFVNIHAFMYSIWCGRARFNAAVVLFTCIGLASAQLAVPTSGAPPSFFHYSVSSQNAVIPGVQVFAQPFILRDWRVLARDACPDDLILISSIC